MSVTDHAFPIPLRERFATAVLISAVIGALIYGWLIFVVLAQMEVKSFGWSLYDEAFLAFMDGHLDLPARVLRIEGHFTPDGAGFLYHGLAPLITRLVFAPFVDIATTPLGPFSIWFWSTLGSALYYAAFYKVAETVWPASGRNAPFWSTLLAIAVWCGGPGLIMASNVSLYQEPIAVSYALTAGVVFLWVRMVYSGLPLRSMIIAMSVLAALTVHARPNVAIGLYTVVLAASATLLWQERRKAIAPLLIALTLLGVGGVSYAVYNSMRFGDTATTHGTFAAGPIQHAMTFWGFEQVDSERAAAFTKHGRFNVSRIAPNVALYGFQPPETVMPVGNEIAKHAYFKATQSWLGKVRIEGPGSGIFFMWTVWALFATAGLFAGRTAIGPWTGLVFGTATSALVTLSYATVTLRYHVDLWPLVAALSIVGIARLAPRIVSAPILSTKPLGIILVVFFGFIVNTGVSQKYRAKFAETPGSIMAVWSAEACRDIADRKAFAEERIAKICRSPRTLH